MTDQVKYRVERLLCEAAGLSEEERTRLAAELRRLSHSDMRRNRSRMLSKLLQQLVWGLSLFAAAREPSATCGD